MEKKIKIDVITLHAVQNYGSVLQALATQEILKQHGCDVTIIDYVREDVRYENLVKKWSGGNPIKALAIIPTILRWKNVFQSFAKKYLDCMACVESCPKNAINPSGIYKKIKEYLIAGRKVLFVGLPCQVEAVKCYVGEKLDNSLYTVDLICHGSPSPKVLDMFLAQYDIDTPKLSDIQFRNKNNFAVREGTSYIVQKGVLDKYSISFLNSISYTENCYHCQYANIMRVSDITLGDSWGSNLDIQEQRKGISLILNQTQKGKELLEQSELELMDVELNRAIEHNHQLRHPSIKPNTREIFFGEIKNGKNFNAIVRKLYPKQSAKQLVKMLLIKAKIMGGGMTNYGRNTGLDVATGRWICFVDGDDYIMPEYVSYMLALGVAYDADIALTTHMFGSFDNKQMDADDVRIWTGEDAVEAILCYKVPIGCYCKMFKREVLKTTRFIPEVFIGEGFNFNVAAFQKSNRILAGKLKTYFYRRDNPTSAMTKFSIKKCECGLKALDIIKENLQIHTDRVQTAWEFADWRTHSDFYDAMVLAKVKNEYPEFYRKCLNVTKQRALVALKVPTTRSNKIRAILMRVCPAIIPFMLKIREKRHNVNISHR